MGEELHGPVQQRGEDKKGFCLIFPSPSCLYLSFPRYFPPFQTALSGKTVPMNDTLCAASFWAFQTMAEWDFTKT